MEELTVFQRARGVARVLARLPSRARFYCHAAGVRRPAVSGTVQNAIVT
jgi:hypothetical protein